MLWARPEAQAHPAGAVKGPAAEDQPVPVAAAAGRDLAAHEDLGAGPSLFRGLPLQEGDPEDGRAFQRHRRARGYAMNELGMDPLFQLHTVPMPSSAARFNMPTRSSSVTWLGPAHPSSIHSTRRPSTWTTVRYW